MIGGDYAVWCVIAPMDMRRGTDQLSQYVAAHVGVSACAGNAYLFSNRARTRLKLLVWDGTGVWLCQRRLHRGHFVWPSAGDVVFELSTQQWQWLCMGVDWQRLAAQPQAYWQA